MSILQLDFAEPFFSIDYVESEDSYHIGKKSMVINLAEHEHENIFLDGERTVVPLKAAMVQDMTIRNLVKAFVIRDVERTDLNDQEDLEIPLRDVRHCQTQRTSLL